MKEPLRKTDHGPCVVSRYRDNENADDETDSEDEKYSELGRLYIMYWFSRKQTLNIH